MNLLRLLGLKPEVSRVALKDGAEIYIARGRYVAEPIRLGPNEVHAFITHPDGDITDLGVGHNLLTNAGRDLVADALGAVGVNNGTNVATAASGTSLTDSGEAWTTDRYAGWTVLAEQGTDTPVHGNIKSNTGTVLTVDAWWNADESAGTTPGATANYGIYPSCRPRFMGLTENASAAAAGNTALTGEISTNGLARARATYAHTAGTSTMTLSKAFTASGSFPAVHRMGLFTALTGGIMVFESVLNADANLVSGDTLTVTDTITLS